MSIEQILYFIEVAKSESFSEAAEHLFTTQSSVSKHILSLERELNISLFDRSCRKIKLTDAGTIALTNAKELAKVYFRMLQSLDEHQHKTNGMLRIASIPVMAQYNITGLIADFQFLYPAIPLNIQELEGIDILSQLKEEKFHFAFMRLENLEQGFECLSIFEDKLSVVLSKQHPLSQHQELALPDLSLENFLLLNKSTLLYDVITKACQKCGFTPSVTYTGTRMENILELVSKNQGISLMMHHAVSYNPNTKISIVPLKETIKSTIGLVRIKDLPLSSYENKFWNYIKKSGNQ